MTSVTYTYKVARQLLNELGIPRRKTGRPPILTEPQRAQLSERYRANPRQWKSLMHEAGVSRATFWRLVKKTGSPDASDLMLSAAIPPHRK